MTKIIPVLLVGAFVATNHPGIIGPAAASSRVECLNATMHYENEKIVLRRGRKGGHFMVAVDAAKFAGVDDAGRIAIAEAYNCLIGRKGDDRMDVVFQDNATNEILARWAVSGGLQN